MLSLRFRGNAAVGLARGVKTMTPISTLQTYPNPLLSSLHTRQTESEPSGPEVGPTHFRTPGASLGTSPSYAPVETPSRRLPLSHIASPVKRRSRRYPDF